MKFFTTLIFTLFVLSMSAQNVGINNPSPQKPLHIKGNNELLRLQGSDPWIGFMNESDSNYRSYLWLDHGTNTMELGSVSGSNVSMALSPNGSGLLYATGTQRIGIGTNDPQVKMHINANESEVFRLQSPAPTMTYFNSIGEYKAFSGLFGNSLSIGTTGNSNFPVKFMPSGQNKMTIMPNGSVSVNSETPHTSAILDLNSIDKGLGLPLVSTYNKNAIEFPKEGLILYDKDQKQINLYTNEGWKVLTAVNPWHLPPSNHVDNISLMGTSIRTSGNQILVTGFAYGTNLNSGVNLYINSATSQPTHFAIPPFESQGFGASSAMEADVVIIGAPKTTVNGHVDAGAVYVYRIPNANGPLELIATITSNNPQPGDEFGHSVEVRKITGVNQYVIYVGAPNKDAGGFTDSELVGRFLLDGNTVSFQNNIVPSVPDRGNSHKFGYALAKIGNHIVVGAPGFNNNGTLNQGAIFSFDDSSTQLFKEDCTICGTNNYFGSAISSYYDKIAVTCRYYTSNPNASGRVMYCNYDQITGVISNIQYWTPSLEEGELQAVDISTDYIVGTKANGRAFIKKFNSPLYPSKTITISRNEGIWGNGFAAFTNGVIYKNLSLRENELIIGAPTTKSFSVWQIPQVE